MKQAGAKFFGTSPPFTPFESLPKKPSPYANSLKCRLIIFKSSGKPPNKKNFFACLKFLKIRSDEKRAEGSSVDLGAWWTVKCKKLRGWVYRRKRMNFRHIFTIPNGVCNVNCLERWISEWTSRNCAMIHVDLDISGCHNLMNRSEKVEQLFSTSYLIWNLLSAISQLELSGSLQSAFCTSCSVRRYFWTQHISSST